MSFDASPPVDHSKIVAAEMRNQLNALKALTDTVPSSPPMMDVLAAQTAGACPDVQELNLTVSNPPTQAQMQAIADKVDGCLRGVKSRRTATAGWLTGRSALQ